MRRGFSCAVIWHTVSCPPPPLPPPPVSLISFPPRLFFTSSSRLLLHEPCSFSSVSFWQSASDLEKAQNNWADLEPRDLPLRQRLHWGRAGRDKVFMGQGGRGSRGGGGEESSMCRAGSRVTAVSWFVCCLSIVNANKSYHWCNWLSTLNAKVCKVKCVQSKTARIYRHVYGSVFPQCFMQLPVKTHPSAYKHVVPVNYWYIQTWLRCYRKMS